MCGGAWRWARFNFSQERTTMSQKPISSLGIEDAFRWHLSAYHGVSVRDFDAVGDGVVNDTAAIQVALNASVGGTLYFPEGTYKITPTAGKVFALPGGVRLVGAGKGKTILKIANGTGAFDAVFYDASHDLSGLVLADLTIDLNTANNPIANFAEIMAHPRVAVYINNGASGTRVRIENLEVKGNNSINTIIVTSALADVVVRGCSFTNVADSNLVAHDHSTLYLMSTYNVVTDNYFEGDGVPGIASACAIETHGAHVVIANNRILKFQNGMNITGVSAVEDTTDVVISGNILDQMSICGVLLWSNQYPGHTSGYGLDGVVICDNTIRIVQTSTAPATASFGIALEPTANLPVRNLTIQGNVLIWEKELVDRDANAASFGIGFYSANNMTLENFSINDNVLENMPMAGIRFSCGIVGGRVTGNLLRNCGSTLHAETAIYRTPIVILPYLMRDFALNGNTIIDDFAVARIPCAVYFNTPVTGTTSGIQMMDNVVNVSGANKAAFTTPYDIAGGCNIHARGRIPDGYVPGQYGQVAGSEWFDASLNRRYVVLAADSLMIAYGYGSAAPVAGTWVAGSIVWNWAPASGQPPGWVCTVGGTPGTWKAMANLA
jgi:hypothetical protein